MVTITEPITEAAIESIPTTEEMLTQDLNAYVNLPAGSFTGLNCYDCGFPIDEDDSPETCSDGCSPVRFDPLDITYSVTINADGEMTLENVKLLLSCGQPDIYAVCVPEERIRFTGTWWGTRAELPSLVADSDTVLDYYAEGLAASGITVNYP